MWHNVATISMPTKHSRLLLRSLLILGLCTGTLSVPPRMAHAQSSNSTELEAILFVQSLAMKNGQDAIQLAWIPQSLQRLCLGKTTQQCSDFDYCVRTTNRDVKICRDLGIPLSRLPAYPPGMVPRRVHSVVLFRLTPDHFANLQDFYRNLPQASLEHLSLRARVKARVRYTAKSDDDDFDVLEILAVAPF